ncbi:protein kinase [Streptomyces sp. NPDC052012]|uniref:serine/threonine-protein kinase n=1 Tax=Streptomyces sp. NPDC052012 TaxID=3155051 RepID=UPI00344E0398
MQGSLVAGRYRLGESIGSGGMGRVWRAHDEVLHRSVAIKELTAALYVSDSEQAMLLARTRAEARAAARINHSAVVTVHDVLEHDGRPWIVMELVEGRSLADAVKEEGRVEPREAARVGMWVLRALRAAHTAGVLHRDVKPGNVLLGRDGRVLLTDFGIAQIDGDTAITRTGEVVGSVDYLAPERVRGHDPGPASDLWALGATLYTAVEGRSPFRRTSPLTTMQAVVEEEATEPRHAGPLAPVIGALLSKDPADRPDAAAAEQMLAEAAEGRRPDSAQLYVPTRAAGAHVPLPDETRPDGAGSRFPHATGPSGPTGQTGQTGPTAVQPPHATGRTAAQPPYAPAGAAVTPTGTVATGPGSAAGPARRKRRRLIALVVALAAVIGGGTAVVLQQWDQSRGDGGTAAPSETPRPSASNSDGAGSTAGLPAGWVRRTDPLGFSIALPGEDWQRTYDEETGQVDYTPDRGKHSIRIAMDDSPDFDDPFEHLSDLDWQIGQRLVDYRRVKLQRDLYRDRPSARLEYTWTALAKDTDFPGPYRAVDQMYISREGVEYALLMTAPADDWATTSEQFETVLKGWREP